MNAMTIRARYAAQSTMPVMRNLAVGRCDLYTFDEKLLSDNDHIDGFW
jgi:hypothetical protein